MQGGIFLWYIGTKRALRMETKAVPKAVTKGKAELAPASDTKRSLREPKYRKKGVAPQFVLLYSGGGVLDPSGALAHSAEITGPTAGDVLTSDGTTASWQPPAVPAPSITHLGGLGTDSSIGVNGTDYLASGLGSTFQFTPTSSGNLALNMAFGISVSTPPDTWIVRLAYGDLATRSPAPTQNTDLQTAPWLGVAVLTSPMLRNPVSSAVSQVITAQVPVFGLTLNHAYWFDIAGQYRSPGDTLLFSDVQLEITES